VLISFPGTSTSNQLQKRPERNENATQKLASDTASEENTSEENPSFLTSWNFGRSIISNMAATLARK
jgi:hypothetical protein